MMPSDLILLLHQQRYQELVRQTELARLVRASRGRPTGDERVFQHLLWWVGGALLSWGCALQYAGRATQTNEKGCNVCL